MIMNLLETKSLQLKIAWAVPNGFSLSAGNLIPAGTKSKDWYAYSTLIIFSNLLPIVDLKISSIYFLIINITLSKPALIAS